jgi:hypothetical protein
MEVIQFLAQSLLLVEVAVGLLMIMLGLMVDLAAVDLAMGQQAQEIRLTHLQAKAIMVGLDYQFLTSQVVVVGAHLQLVALMVVLMQVGMVEMELRLPSLA